MTTPGTESGTSTPTLNPHEMLSSFSQFLIDYNLEEERIENCVDFVLQLRNHLVR
jgi:hypothetical protein